MIPGISFGQRADFLVVHDKPVFSIEARLGKYWNIDQPEDSLSALQYDHLKALSQGIRYDVSALFHLGEHFELGLTFVGLSTSNTVSSVNIIVITPQYDTLNLYGDLKEGISQSFIGPRVDARIKLGDFVYLRPGISVGYLKYTSKTNAAGYKYALVGGTLAVDIHASLQYKADENWGIMLAASIMPSFIYEPTLEFENGGSIVYTDGLLNVGHYHVGLGISYTFTKPNKEKVPQYFRAH